MATRIVGKLTGKLLLLLVIAGLLGLGLVGLVLPVIPGILFLVIAAVVVSKQSSSIDRWLRRNSTVSGYMDHADGFIEMAWADKLRYAGWLSLKMTLDFMRLIGSAVATLAARAYGEYREYQRSRMRSRRFSD